MKKSIFVLLFSIFGFAAFAQAPISAGKMQLNAGLGFSSWGIPFYVGMDFGVHPDVTAGVEGSYRSYDNKGTDSDVFGLIGNANYHFNRIMKIQPNWDVYAGLNVGAYFTDGGSGLDLGAQIGARYYFKSNMGINIELGGGRITSGGKIGISVKL